MLGILEKLSVVPDGDSAAIMADYALVVGAESVPLNRLVGSGLHLRAIGAYRCSGCGEDAKKLFGGAYCYDCFSTLARCDLCVMSPSRCHYAEGTCREPAWGEAFCMQPHLVYLANSSGPKVGITKHGRQLQRWMDQGACQAVVIAQTQTRKCAGELELVLSQILSDRTDWKRLVNTPPKPVDLVRLVPQLRQRAQTLMNAASLTQVDWYDSMEPVSIDYPVDVYSPPTRIKLGAQQTEIRDNISGIKGQFLLLTQGVFNVAEHQGFEVEVHFSSPFAMENISTSDQLTLF